jgi:hypothetical protein
MDIEEKIIRDIIDPSQKKKIHYTSLFLEEHSTITVPAGTDLVILNRSFGNDHTEQQYQLLKDKIGDIDFVLLTSNYRYHKQTHPNILYFPLYYFYILKYIGVEKINFQDKRPHKIQCLNLNPWLHRTVNFLRMRKRTWYDQCQLSFHWRYKVPPNMDNNDIVNNMLPDLTDTERKELMTIDLPITIDEDWHKHYAYVTNKCSVHQTCYIDYVTESSTKQEFITEKTWKPIFSGQLFLVLGSVNIAKHLQDLGIDTFDDIINHQRYDTVQDARTKIDLVLEQLDSLMNSDIDQLWDKTYDRRKRNYELACSSEFQFKMSEELIKRVS